VYTPDGDVLDKHLHVLRRAPGGFDWGPEADEARIDQLAIALLADSTTKNIALDHYKEFAEFLREELEGDEWRLPTSDISADTWSREIDVADETPSPEDVDITTVEFDEMSFAVERALCEKHDISVHQSVDSRRAELDATRDNVHSEAADSDTTGSESGEFEFPAASQERD
jgi:hypothetical protein